jgi:hypothetical protein
MSDNANIANKSAARAGIDRRTVIAGGVGALAAPAVLRVIPANAQSKTIKIGHVSPKDRAARRFRRERWVHHRPDEQDP